jgi:CRISPR/Cas system CSM-associated protein Csm3 (group 7 of RAMP superfamily)
MTTHPLNDAMGPRPLTARWTIQGQLVLVTALHLGGGESDNIDSPVLRDGRSGRPLLPGTTLAGALRSALADRLAGYAKREPVQVSRLFGGRRGDDFGAQSPLIVYDAIGELPAGAGIEIRDGVALSPSTGITEDHKKFDFEVLPAGTKFPVRLDLLVPNSPEVNEAELLAGLAAALDAFSHGENGFGARRTRGLGKVEAKWHARRHDLATRQGWLEWARSDHKPGPPSTLNSIRDAIASAWNVPKSKPLADARALVKIELALNVKHDVLVRSAGTTPGAPDVSHLRSGGAPILPGTGQAGVMRAHALRIAKLIRRKDNDAAQWIDRLFGPRFEGQRAASDFEPRASRLRVGEAKVERSKPHRQVRIAIDRFTQGVVDGALFDEQPEVGGAVSVILELRDPQPGELGLLLLVVKDILDGRLPVGGSSSIGRGFLAGTARMEIRSGGNGEPTTAELRPREQPTGTAAAAVAEAIETFRNVPSLVEDPTATSAAHTGVEE